MILRSVTKHVKDQNWFAVFLDLLIVVIGVFIGIQVSNWNEQIAGQKQAQVLLKRIHHDLNNDILSMQAELEYQGAVRNYAMTAVDALNGVNAVSDEQFVIGAYQASQINGVWSNRATYNEMLSTGQINLIKDEQLKGLIFGYFALDFATIPLIVKMAPYREFIRGHMPVVIQDAIKAQCGDMTFKLANSFAATLPSTCDLDLADEVLSEAADLLRSLPEMKFNLNFQIAVNDAKVINFHNYIKECENLLATIEGHQP